jgi:hypothetical protein
MFELVFVPCGHELLIALITLKCELLISTRYPASSVSKSQEENFLKHDCGRHIGT